MSGFLSSDSAMHNEFMGFLGDDDSLFAVRAWAERQGYPAQTVQQGGADRLASLLESTTAPQMVIVDCDGQDDRAATAARLAGLCGRDCRVILVGSVNDVALYRKIIAAGAVDYMVKPLNADQLNQALAAALRQQNGAKSGAKEARLITVIGARGGVGASTLALNLGWFLAHEAKLKTVLLDLDLQFGTSSLALDLEAGRGLRDIVASPHRVDSLMIASSVINESPLFSVLGAEEAVDDVVLMDGGAITALVKQIKNDYGAVVVDLPHFLFAAQKRILPMAHEIVIVSELTLSGIRDTLRIKNAVTALGCTARITIVASRTQSSGAGQIDAAVFEKGVQDKIGATLVEDGATILTAANTGKALGITAPRAVLTKAIRDLAMRFVQSDEAPVTKKSLWAKLTGNTKSKDAKRSAP